MELVSLLPLPLLVPPPPLPPPPPLLVYVVAAVLSLASHDCDRASFVWFFTRWSTALRCSART